MPVPSKTVDAATLNSTFRHFSNNAISRVEKLAGDASSRHYYRLHTKSSETFVLQVSESFQDAESHPFLCGQKILKAIGIPVPECLEMNKNLGWILLSDLGDLTLQQKPQSKYYFEAIDFLIHWSKEAHAENQKIDSLLRAKAPHFKWAFDVEKLSFEMNYTQEHLIEKFCKRSRSENFSMLSRKNTDFLAQRPRVFCHRDYHSRNLMVTEQGKLVVIDFQDSRMGPCTYDLVSLLWDPYAKLDQSLRQELYSYWLKSAQEAKIAGAIDSHLPEELERMKLQRLMKAAGSYASFLNLKGRKDYLPYILPAIEESALSIEQLRKLKKASAEDEEILTLLRSLQKEIPVILRNQ